MSDLVVEHLEVRYGDLIGVADVSLRSTAASIVALLGSNGAGKTTTLNAIAGLVHASKGRITWRGEVISGQPAYQVVGKGLALSPEGWRLFVSQTVEQNLRLGATALADRTRIAALFDRVYATVPSTARATPSTGPHVVGRRKTDVGARTSTDERTENVDARRAEPRSRANRCRDRFTIRCCSCTRMGLRSCWRSNQFHSRSE